MQKAKWIPGGAPWTDLEFYYTKKANRLWVFRSAANQLWLQRQLPLRFLFKHQHLLVFSRMKYSHFSIGRSQKGFRLEERALPGQSCHTGSHYLPGKIQITVLVSQGIICRFLVPLLLQRFNLSFILIYFSFRKVHAVYIQYSLWSSSAKEVQQMKGDRCVLFLMSPLMLTL